MPRDLDSSHEEEAEMSERAPEDAPAKVTIRNVTRSALSIQVPGESIRLQPGQFAEVHQAYLDTPELRTLSREGAISRVERRPPAKAGAAEEEDTEPGGGPGRRTSSRKR
jgi:hypothetical protein